MALEILYARLSEPPVFGRKLLDTRSLIAAKGDALIEQYYLLSGQIEANERELDRIYASKINAFKIKKCFCGGSLRYIESYNFWGCSNYRSTGEHFSAHGREPVFYRGGGTPVNAHWVSDLINACNLHGQITAKQAFLFLMDEGLEDLRLKYGCNPTYKNINCLTEANVRSKKQEAAAKVHLEKIYSKVVHQQCIAYQLKDKPAKFCFPDFICSTTETVTVFECKLDYPNDEQLDLYVQLIAHILSHQHTDARPVFGAYIMYSKPYMETKFPVTIIKEPDSG